MHCDPFPRVSKELKQSFFASFKERFKIWLSKNDLYLLQVENEQFGAPLFLIYFQWKFTNR